MRLGALKALVSHIPAIRLWPLTANSKTTERVLRVAYSTECNFHMRARIPLRQLTWLSKVMIVSLLLIFGFALSTANQARAQQQGFRSHSQEIPSSEFRKKEDILIFINAYRENKEPDRVPGALHAMVRLGMLRDPEQAGIYIGFIAGVIADNQIEAPNLIARMFPLPPAAQVILIKAIAYSGLPDWKRLLSQFSERMPARKVLIKRYLYQNGKTLYELPLHKDPQVIDTHWGYYFATGRYEAVLPIISTLAWAKDGDDVEKLTAGSMSKWTLASNASRDKNLLDLFKSELNHQPKDIRGELRDIIQAAETFELAAIRKNAFSAIDTLKAKGPATQRSITSWGETGTTVLALGCVVASALGQVEFGIPCVIGGALSQAAVNYWKRTTTQ